MPLATTAEGAEERGVTVPRDDLGGDGFDGQAECGGDVRLYRRVKVRVGADGAADGADGDFRAGGEEAGAVAGELGVVPGEF